MKIVRFSANFPLFLAFFLPETQNVPRNAPFAATDFLFHKIFTHSWHFLFTFHQFLGELTRNFLFFPHLTDFREFSLDFLAIFAAQICFQWFMSCHIEILSLFSFHTHLSYVECMYLLRVV
jgi:hypothetical protein